MISGQIASSFNRTGAKFSLHEKTLYLLTAVHTSRPNYLTVDHLGCVCCCVRRIVDIRVWRQYMAGMARASDACPYAGRILRPMDRSHSDRLSRWKENGSLAGA